MAIRYFCDICECETEDAVRVGWRYQYCKKCWKDKKNWPKIHSVEEK